MVLTLRGSINPMVAGLESRRRAGASRPLECGEAIAAFPGRQAWVSAKAAIASPHSKGGAALGLPDSQHACQAPQIDYRRGTQYPRGNIPLVSLNRFVYYCAVTGAWAALAAWLVTELIFFQSGTMEAGWLPRLRDTLTAAALGGGIAAGLSVVSGMTNARWRQLLKRAGLGFLGGLAGGMIGGALGVWLHAGLGAPLALGWLVMGLGIGVTEGLYERSTRKIRNGFIGGTLGGLVGGLLFDPIARAGSEMPGRATAFVILGLLVGAAIGLAHVVLKEAWLTVLDGFRPGRQLILSRDVTVLGRAEHLPLPFMGHADTELEPEHVRIVRQPSGQYLLEDNHTRAGTLLNSQPVTGPVVLQDGDLVKLGTNIVRFSHRHRRRDAAPGAGEAGPARASRPIAPPPLPVSPSPRPSGLAAVPPEGQIAASPPAEVRPAAESTGPEPGGPVCAPGVGPMRPPPPPPK